MAAAHEQYCSVVRASAAGSDDAAIAFHQALGFVVEDDDHEADRPLPYGEREAGEPRVGFVRVVTGPLMTHPRPERETAA